MIIVDTLKPFMAAVLGKAVLGEDMNGWAVGGMVITATAVLMVSLEKEVGGEEEKEEEEDVKGGGADFEIDVDVELCVKASPKEASPSPPDPPLDSPTDADLHNVSPKVPPKALGQSLGLGYTLALGNVVLDAYGSVLTKQHGSNMTTWEINLVRFGSAAVAMALISAACRTWEWGVRKGGDEGTPEPLVNKEASTHSPGDTTIRKGSWYRMPSMPPSLWWRITLGVFFVTFCCPALSNYALFQIQLGLALTLNGTGPVYSLPLVAVMKGERITVRAAGWTAVAVGGVAVLCLKGMD